MRTINLKNYSFSFEDKDGNELERRYFWHYNIKKARVHASELLGNSMSNDLDKIIVKREYEKY